MKIGFGIVRFCSYRNCIAVNGGYVYMMYGQDDIPDLKLKHRNILRIIQFITFISSFILYMNDIALRFFKII